MVLYCFSDNYEFICDNSYKSKFQKKEILPYFYFVIAPIIGSIIQMYYPSSASFQVGITISLLMIFFNYQNNMIQKDPLTGFKNRQVLER